MCDVVQNTCMNALKVIIKAEEKQKNWEHFPLFFSKLITNQ